MARNSSLSPSFLLVLAVCLLLHPQFHCPLVTGDNNNNRKALEIIIGGDGPSESPAPSPESEECPPPPPPPLCPVPSPPPLPPSPPLPSPPPPPPPPPPRSGGFVSPLIQKVYPIIKKFQANIEEDPKGVLKTWIGKDICSKDKYRGLECAVFPGTNYLALASIQFNQFNFGGKNLRLDGFLDKLDEVTIFHANSNKFVGTVPAVSQIQYLFELDLSNNKLSGEFPNSVLRATNLTFLDLRFNTFSGSVPPQVFNLDLDVLFINNNNLVQRLPENLGAITALYLTFANNRFTGPIPSSIGNIKYLREVLFLNNQLTGCLPYQIGLLNRATVFDVGFNHLTGPIPNSFGCLNKMEQLNLARNKFYGTVPEIVCDLPKLQNLSLSYNYFTQVGPNCRELIKKKVLDIRKNCIIDLPNQRSPEECAKFFMWKESCPNSKSFYWIPCNKNPYHQRNQEEQSDALASPPISYNALTPDRLRRL